MMLAAATPEQSAKRVVNTCGLTGVAAAVFSLTCNIPYRTYWMQN